MKRDGVRRALRSVSRRIRLCRLVRSLQLGLMLAAFAAFAWAVASFFTPIESLVRYASLSAAVLLVSATLAGFLRPVGALCAARAADDLGLEQRALTALTALGDGAMHTLQREDALQRLKSLDVCSGIRPRARRPELIAGAVLLCATVVLSIIPNPQQDKLNRMRAFEKKMQTLAEAAEMRERPETPAEEGAENPELRRIERELLDRIAQSRSEREALSALGDAEQKLSRVAKEGPSGASESAADSPGTGRDGGDIAQDAENAAGNSEAAGAKASGQGAEGLSGEAVNAEISNLSSLIAQLRQGVNKASSDTGQGSGNRSGQGKEGGEGQGQAPGDEGGSGAGRGSTNLDQGLGGEMKNKRGGEGIAAPELRVGQYETIYDPARLDGAEDPFMAQGELGEGEISRVQLGPGEGRLDEDVPYDRVVGEYAQKAAKAADDASVSPNVRQWVIKYFDSLID